MKWRAVNIGELDNSSTKGGGHIKLRVTVDGIERLALGLTLLAEDLIERLELPGKHGATIVVSRDPNGGDPILGLHGPRIDLRLSFDTVEYLQIVCLQAVRDGFAAVDHIDLDCVDSEKPTEKVYFTFYFPIYAPPITPEETRRRLGL